MSVSLLLFGFGEEVSSRKAEVWLLKERKERIENF